MSFSNDLNRFIERAGDNANDAISLLILSIGEQLIDMSPVGNPSLWQSPPPPGYVGGRFRSNWSYKEGAAELSERDIEDASQTRDRMLSAVPEVTIGKVHYITNNLPYAIPIENGHSTQAPSGLVGLTMINTQQMVRDAVREVTG